MTLFNNIVSHAENDTKEKHYEIKVMFNNELIKIFNKTR